MPYQVITRYPLHCKKYILRWSNVVIEESNAAARSLTLHTTAIINPALDTALSTWRPSCGTPHDKGKWPRHSKQRLTEVRSNRRTGGFSDAKAYIGCLWNVRNTGFHAAGYTCKCSRKPMVLHEARNSTLHLCHRAPMPGFSERKRRFLLSTPSCSLSA